MTVDLNKPDKIDWTKPLQTRDGRYARLLGVVHAGAPPYVVVVMDSGQENVYLYFEDGVVSSRDSFEDNLINIPEAPKPVTYFHDVYAHYEEIGDAIPSLEDTSTAQRLAVTWLDGRITHVKVLVARENADGSTTIFKDF